MIISIADFGLGIPAKVREKLPGLTDSAAIIQAVQEGFTTKSTFGNRGVGLDYLLRTIVLANHGKVTFYSHNAIVRFEEIGASVHPVILSNVGFCPGTTIDISLRADKIEVLPEESEDLKW